MRLAPNLRLRGGTATRFPSPLALSLSKGELRIASSLLVFALSCARETGRSVDLSTPSVVEASVLTVVLIGAPLLLAAVAVFTLLRRRRGPEPLSRLLIAGSLRDMQRPRPYRHGTEP